MSAVGCIVCGIPVFNHQSEIGKPRSCLYRAIYRDGIEAKITGLGRHDDSATWAPPRDLNGRWDNSDNTIELTVSKVRQLSGDDCHGFLLHESCWSLLRKVCEPKSINLYRLLEVCESLPYPLRTNTVYWGHDFRGLWTLDDRNAFSWEERFFVDHQISTVYFDGLEDPFNVADIPNRLSADVQLPFTTPLCKVSRDCFDLFPTEILDEIGMSLSTQDALNLRLASASFLPLYSSRHFWASRFSKNNERGFFFEAHEYKEPIQLLNLYKYSSPSRRSPGLRNRRRVWSLAKAIVETIQRDLYEYLPDTVRISSFHTTLTCSAGKIHPDAKVGYWYLFHDGCRVLGKSTVTIPKDLIGVGITVLDTGLCTYISGIQFVSRSGISTKVGYVTQAEERMFVASKFNGFKVAVAKSGIRAIQLVEDGWYSSQWAGDPSGSLLSNFIFKAENVQQIAISYDGFKIVSLGKVPPDYNIASLEPILWLRQAMWYPSVPPEQVCLNDSLLRRPRMLQDSFEPLLFVDFGGTSGEFLHCISGISVQCIHAIHGIKILYEQNSRSDGVKKLGRCESSEVSPSSIFEINGKLGERITAIEVIEPTKFIGAEEPKALQGIRFITSYEREYEIRSQSSFDRNFERLALTSHTVITGFYARNDSDIGLYGLGLISALE